MAKSNSKTETKGMHGGGATKQKGRTSITDTAPSPDTTPHVPQTVKSEANRPVNAGGGKHRGDRRDMSPTYTGNAKHKSRGSNPRKDVSTRAR